MTLTLSSSFLSFRARFARTSLHLTLHLPHSFPFSPFVRASRALHSISPYIPLILSLSLLSSPLHIHSTPTHILKSHYFPFQFISQSHQKILSQSHYFLLSFISQNKNIFQSNQSYHISYPIFYPSIKTANSTTILHHLSIHPIHHLHPTPSSPNP